MDSSCLIALALGEPKAAAMRRALGRHDRLFASNLLEAELRSALMREELRWADSLTAPIAWILPDRPLGPEMARALVAGRLRGADLWHMACALFLGDQLEPLVFLTLDERQRAVAEALGMEAPRV